jgi:NitT/TauT family transport system substrate-binding protein
MRRFVFIGTETAPMTSIVPSIVLCLRRLIACLALAGPALVTLPAATAQAQTNLRFVLDWAFQGQHAMFTMPGDDGTFRRLGLNLTVDRGVGSGDTVVKVASGAYDLGIADLYSMVRFNGQKTGQPLIAVMMVDDKSALGVETLAGSSIKTPQDLAGKRVGSPLGDASRQVFPLFAEVNKIDQGSIKWSNIAPELREPMLVRGEVDAITGHITTAVLNLRAMNVPASAVRILPYVDYGIDLYGHAIVVRPDFAQKNPEAVRNFIRGAVAGFNAMIKDRDGAIASLKKRDGLLNGDVEKERIQLSLDYRMMTDNIRRNGASSIDPGRLDRSVKAAGRAFELATIPAAAEIYTDAYLPPRAEMKISE